MFQIGDAVFYGTDGVCRITAIVRKAVGGLLRDYYELHPVYRRDAVLYLPTDNEKVCSRLRRVLTRDEIMTAIRAIPEEECLWVDSDNRRKELCQEVLRSGDHVRLIRMIKSLYGRRDILKEQGRRMHAADENFLKEAEKILHEEFAYVLNISQTDVLSFIRAEIGLEAASTSS